MVENELVGRLRELMEHAGITQSQLADRLGMSQAAVSHWIKGKKTPTNENIHQIASAFGVSPEWLHYGTGPGLAPNLEAARRDYEAQRGWRFRPAPTDRGRDYGNANVWAFDPNIWTMVRDIIQNSRDAAPGGAKVGVTFRVIRLRGAELEKFKTALDWPGLLPHLEASAEIPQRLGRLIKHNLAKLEKERELLLLVVEDIDTIGLIGEEFDKGNFAALCRNNLDSEKSGTAGGAFGLGKAVLWRVSEFSLVLFGSHLSRPISDGNQYYRVFGRCDLPWHEFEGEVESGGRFAGPGWFGKVSGDLTTSFWDNPALAADLYLNRNHMKLGTSIVVVGFHDPSNDDDCEPFQLAGQIERAVGDWFWPDLTNGRLQAIAETYDGPKRTYGTDISAEKLRHEYVDAVQKWKAGDLVEQLIKEGDVVCCRVPLRVPKRVAEPMHPEAMHEAVLLVRRAADDSKSDRLSELGVYRGVGMVVQYLSLRGICLGALPFHAALLCGEAAGAEPECLMADRFLRTSEPPAHECWTSTPDLKTEYVKGGKSSIDQFIRDAKNAVREIVRPSMKDLSDGPNALKELFKIGEASPVDDRPKITRPNGTIDSDGGWTVEARIRVTRGDHAWWVQPVVVFQQETGGGKPVRWRKLEAVNNCTVDDDRILIPPNTGEARFTGSTDPTSHPIAARESSIVIDARQFGRIPGGEA